MKKRIRRGDPRRGRYWKEVMRRWRESGKGVRAFCRDEGVRESAFYFWRQKLAQRDRQVAVNGSPTKASPAAATLRSVQRRSPQRGPMPSFLPVQVVEPGVTGAACGVEIVLERGCRVRVQAGFDQQTLADVLAVLEVRSC